MKRLICFLIIINLIFLSGCSYFVADKTDNEPTVNNENKDDKDYEKNPPVEDTEDDPIEDPEKNPEDNQGDNNNTENNPDDTGNKPENKPTQVSGSIGDYITDLIDTEYCIDKDFIQFLANLDNRQAKNIVYVSNNGEGDGSYDDPMSLMDAIDSAKAGQTIYLRGGEYIFTESIWISASGTKDNYITIKSYPGEKAVLTTTPENVSKYDEDGEYIFFGIDEGCSYIIFEDLEIHGATDENVAAFVCYDGGQNHLIFINNDIHDLSTTYLEGGANAFLFMGEKKKSINNIALIGNRCHDLTLGYSEAVSFAGNCEYCYVISNEVYDNTNIGIDFYGNAGYCSTKSLDQARYCVAAYNTVYNCNSPYADCAGIYVDGGRNCLIEGNLIYNCQYGIEIGSEEKKDDYPVTDIIVRNNVMKNNTVCAMRLGGYDTKSSGTVKNTKVYNNSFINNGGGYDIILSKADNISFANNIFVGKNEFVETEFSISYISNLHFYNNYFDGVGSSITLYGESMSMDALNSRYGGGNTATDISVRDDFGINKKISGSAEFTSKYDFYLVLREENQIGAVEFSGE